MLRYIDVLEPAPTHTDQGCFLCEAKPGDGHWSTCPFSEGGSADTDPDADGDFTAADRARFD